MASHRRHDALWWFGATLAAYAVLGSASQLSFMAVYLQKWLLPAPMPAQVGEQVGESVALAMILGFPAIAVFFSGLALDRLLFRRPRPWWRALAIGVVAAGSIFYWTPSPVLLQYGDRTSVALVLLWVTGVGALIVLAIRDRDLRAAACAGLAAVLPSAVIAASMARAAAETEAESIWFAQMEPYSAAASGVVLALGMAAIWVVAELLERRSLVSASTPEPG